MLAMAPELMVFIPVIIDTHGPQVEDGLGTCLSPTHSGSLHAVLDQVTAGTLDDTGANGPPLSQTQVLAHIGQVASIVADGSVERSKLGRGERRVLNTVFQGLDETAQVLPDRMCSSCSFIQGVRSGLVSSSKALAASHRYS